MYIALHNVTCVGFGGESLLRSQKAQTSKFGHKRREILLRSVWVLLTGFRGASGRGLDLFSFELRNCDVGGLGFPSLGCLVWYSGW